MRVPALMIFLFVSMSSTSIKAMMRSKIGSHIQSAESLRVLVDEYRKLEADYNKSNIYLKYFREHILAVEANASIFWEKIPAIRTILNSYPTLDAFRAEKEAVLEMLEHTQFQIEQVKIKKDIILERLDDVTLRTKEINDLLRLDGINSVSLRRFKEFVNFVQHEEEEIKLLIFSLAGAHQLIPRLQKKILARVHRLTTLVKIEMEKFCSFLEDTMRPECMIPLPLNPNESP